MPSSPLIPIGKYLLSPIMTSSPTFSSLAAGSASSPSGSLASSPVWESGRPAAFSSSAYVRSYLGPDIPPRSPDLENGQMRSRSPRTPSSAQFEPSLTNLNLAVPNLEKEHRLYPSAYSRPRSAPKFQVANQPLPPAQSQSQTPSYSPLRPSRLASRIYPDTPKNIPSRPIPHESWARSLPRPSKVIRLLTIVAALALGALLLARMRLARISALQPQVIPPRGIIRRGENGRYEPPQIRSAHMMERAKVPKATRAALSFAVHPIPPTHEFLALQSYLLQSNHNVLPETIDPSQPLDADTILAISPSKLGAPGSQMEAAWLRELEKEREEDVVIWGPAGSRIEVEQIYELLDAISVSGRTPALVNLDGRSDASLLHAILARLGISSQMNDKKPMIMIGNKSIYGGKAELERMRENGELQAQLETIGWLDAWKAAHLETEADAKEAEKKEEEDKAHKPKIMNAAFRQ